MSDGEFLRVSGMGESAVDEIAAPIYTKYADVQTSILFNKSEVEIHIAARADDSNTKLKKLPGNLRMNSRRRWAKPFFRQTARLWKRSSGIA